MRAWSHHDEPEPEPKPTHRAPPGRLCAAGCAGSFSPPYPRGFSPAPETETCFSSYCLLPLAANSAAAASLAVVALLSQAVIVGLALRTSRWRGKLTQARLSVSVQRRCYLSPAPPYCLHVTSRDSQLSGVRG